MGFLVFTYAWELRKLGDKKSYYTDGNYGSLYPSKNDFVDKGVGIAFLKGSNLRDGKIISRNLLYITREKNNELTSGHLEIDDIVIAVRGSLGSLGYVEKIHIGWNINSQLAIIRTDKNELSGRYLIQYLLSQRGQRELSSRNTGTALKQLPINQLKDIFIPITKIKEQQKIGTIFKHLDELITLHQRRLF